jgi:molybdenum cofactor biosynthesis enzyme MoaA
MNTQTIQGEEIEEQDANPATYPAIRALLTTHCNYKCVFCHHEGVAHGQMQAGASQRWVELLQAAVREGCTDITLSGGEPLLVRQTLLDIIKGLAASTPTACPHLTIISNGTLVAAPLVRTLQAYPGPKKIHISFHARTPALYAALTGSAASQKQVVRNIRALVTAGIPVKLNVVVVRGANDTAAEFTALLQTAVEMGVKAVKFIPLLGRASDHWFTQHYVAPDDILRILLAGGARPVRQAGRTTVLADGRYPAVDIEATRCVCHLGCQSCPGFRSVIIGPDFRSHPCMLAEHFSTSLATPVELWPAFHHGRSVMAAQAVRYGAGSPLSGHPAQERAVA